MHFQFKKQNYNHGHWSLYTPNLLKNIDDTSIYILQSQTYPEG